MFKRSPFAPSENPEMFPVKGVQLAALTCGLKASGNKDLMLMVLPERSVMAGVFTQSSTAAAPIDWCRDCLSGHGYGRAIIVHSGYANAFTGLQGEQFVETLATAVAEKLSCATKEVYVCATGVIGQQVPEAPVLGSLDDLMSGLSEEHWDGAAEAILTTDTFPKMFSQTCEVDGQTVSITGISKGSGMIMPNMATMLGFVATDLDIESEVLQTLLQDMTQKTFNSISVDSDTSTNDTVLLCSSREVKLDDGVINSVSDPRLAPFIIALEKVMKELAMLIVKDGEGISKLIEIQVSGAVSESSAKKLGLSIANSPLVKTAMAGSDPNWGRIVMAIGKSDEPVDKYQLIVEIGRFRLAENGNPVKDVDMVALTEYMKGPEIIIRVDVKKGSSHSTVWTTDLTHGYIEINADYTT